MAKITLGGERLGSGKKMEVNIPQFNRSSHDQGFVFTSDQAFGTLVPALCNIGTRGDVFYLDDIASLVRTLPTNGPVFGSVKQQIDVFCAPIRLYIGALHNNATGIGLKMSQIKLPVIEHTATVISKDAKLKNPNIPNVAPDSLSAYLGDMGSKTPNQWMPGYKYNEMALFHLMYWDIYKNYYANKQEEEGVVIAGKTSRAGTLKKIRFQNQGETIVEQTDLNTLEGDVTTWESANITTDDVITFITNRKLTNDEIDKLYINVASTGNSVIQLPLSKNSVFRLTTYEIDGEYLYTFTAGAQTTYRPKRSAETGLAGGTILWHEEVNMNLERFPLSNIDKMREAILAAPIGVPLKINKVGGSSGMLPYNAGTQIITAEDGTKREARSKTMNGLAVKCHLSDMFNNWIQTDWLEGENGINDLTSIDTTSGQFAINEFILDYKLFRMMNRIAISDGSYDGWQTAVYGQEGRVMTESPVYCGGYSSEIAFNEVVSQSATADEPLGSLAGRGAQQDETKKGGKNIKVVCDEAMLIMVISSFTPRVTYSQGRKWWCDLESMDDLHKPDLDGIAFQNLTTSSMGAWNEVIGAEGQTLLQKSIGKQTAWLEYTTEVDHSYGDFAAGMPLEHLVLNRSYQDNGMAQELVNATTYIDPTEFNVIFADTELTAKPFWVQIAFNLTSRRKMSAVQIPNL